MSENKEVVALIPAYNEENCIYETVLAALSIPEISGVIVVDDGSTDNTALKAKLAGAMVHSLPHNMGKGEALNRGVRLISAKIIVLLDADLGFTAKKARHLLLPVLYGQADMTIARFPKSKRKAGFGLVKRLAKEGIKRYTGLVMESPLSGQRAMTKELLEKVIPFAQGFGVEVALTIKAARLGFKVLEVPVDMHHKESSRDLRGFLHRGRQFWHVARVLTGIGR